MPADTLHLLRAQATTSRQTPRHGLHGWIEALCLARTALGKPLPLAEAMGFSAAAFRAYFFTPDDNHAYRTDNPGVEWLEEVLEVENYGVYEALSAHTGTDIRLYDGLRADAFSALVAHELEAGRPLIVTDPLTMLSRVLVGRGTKRLDLAAVTAVEETLEVDDALASRLSVSVLRPTERPFTYRADHFRRVALDWSGRHLTTRHELFHTLATWRSSASAWKAPEPPRIEVCNEAFVVLRPDTVQTNINWVGPGIRQADPEYFHALLANQVLGGNAGARLFMNLRESKSYTYGAYSRLSQIYGGAWFTAFSNVRGPVTAGALTEFRNEFARMAEGTIDDKELAGAVDYLAGIFPIQIEENGPLADVMLRTLDQGLELDYLKTYRERVRGVTREQAETAARRNMSGTAFSLIMVGTEEQTVANAKAQSSKVNVYDLDGKKIREEAGSLARLCTGR